MNRLIASIALSVVAASAATAQSGLRYEARTAADGSVITVQEGEVAATPAQVWPLISTVEGWRRWSAPVAWSGGPNGNIFETSNSPNATQGNPENVQHEILAMVPNRMLIFRTIRTPPSLSLNNALRNVVWIVELLPTSHGTTTVRLTGTRFMQDRASATAVTLFRGWNSEAMTNLQHVFASPPTHRAR